MTVLAGFQGTAAASACMAVELRSRELLVVWTALCLADAAARAQHPQLLKGYGVGVSWRDLRHLALSSRAAADALCGVAAYLRRHSVPTRPLFTLQDGGAATFEFARQFGEADRQLLQLWQQEEASAEARQQAHWAEVQQKKQEAARLRALLPSLKAKQADAHEKYNQAEAYFRNAPRWDHSFKEDLRRCSEQLQKAHNKVAETERQLASVLQPPKRVVQPLPEERAQALKWLFFLYMPPLFR